MSWKFGGVYLKKRFQKETTALLKNMGYNLAPSGRFIRFTDAVNADFYDTAVGFTEDITLVQNNFMIYDCSFEPGKTYAFDENLIMLSRETELFCFGIDEISDAVFYSIFRNGTIEKRYAVISGEQVLNEVKGISLPNDNPGNGKDNQEVLFGLIHQFTGFDFHQLVLNDNLILEIYN